MTKLSKHVYSIPAELPFIEVLAEGIVDHAATSSFDLEDYLVFLPTRRAVRSLREAFLRQSGGKPLLLPRIVPLGDLDEEGLFIMGWEGSGIEASGKIEFDIPDAISNTHRQLMLTKHIMILESQKLSIDQATRLASELGRLLDQVHIEQIDFTELRNLVPDEYAQHWKVTLKFLEVITKFWPGILEEKGLIDLAKRRNLIMKAQLSHWTHNPPENPIIAAGSTGSMPATANLLSFISTLSHGSVILPGLDQSLDIDEVHDVETHPQCGLFRLLRKFGLTINDVQLWPREEIRSQLSHGLKPALSSRKKLVFNIMQPAKKVSDWLSLGSFHDDALEGVECITCRSPDEEAVVIALKLREALETPNKTAALITPDRGIARRVCSELRRWGITIDDSAGRPLKQTVPGSYLRLTAKLVANNYLPIDLLAIGKHPITSGGVAPTVFRRLIRDLEIAVLRGPCPLSGIDGLLELLNADQSNLRQLVENIRTISSPFCDVMNKDRVSLGELLRTHITFAEALAVTDEQLGRERLWLGEEGEAASKFISELMEVSDALGNISGSSYPGLLDVLFDGRVARRSSSNHPRLAIWGLLEARLQSADLVIIAGLNEGTWPPEVASDPWMSRPMRKAFGLPSLERRIGLTAHDFQQAFLAPEVMMTRSSRVGGSPTTPSRWLVRLQKFLVGLDQKAAENVFKPSRWLYWQSLLDRPEKVEPITPPAPCPPIEARPRKLSVTQIETWMRDPYAIYAEHILGLRSLPKLNAAPDAGNYGTLIHNVMDAFSLEFRNELPAGALGRLLEIGEEKFKSIIKYPGVWAFWWPRFLRIAEWFVVLERGRRQEVMRVHSEVRGVLEFKTSGGNFLLTAKADRIDELKNGGLRIIDYKTGSPPNSDEVAAGFAPQLPLEAAIAKAGGFEGITSNLVSGLDYWRLRGSLSAGEVVPVADNPVELAQKAEVGLVALISLFNDVDTPYESRPRPENAPKFSDYEHFSRIKEWSTSGGPES